MASLLPQRRLLGNTFRDHSIFIERQDLRGEIRRSEVALNVFRVVKIDVTTLNLKTEQVAVRSQELLYLILAMTHLSE